MRPQGFAEMRLIILLLCAGTAIAQTQTADPLTPADQIRLVKAQRDYLDGKEQLEAIRKSLAEAEQKLSAKCASVNKILDASSASCVDKPGPA